MCGRRRPHTKDHCPPQWITRCIIGDDASLRLIKGDGDGPPIYRHSGARHSNEVGICEVCHQAFNKTVEDWGSGALRALVAAEAATTQIEPSELPRLAAWCFKTAMISDLTDPPGLMPESHRRWFAERCMPPPSAVVRVGTVADPSAGWFLQRNRLTVSPIGELARHSIYVFTARAGAFFFQVIGPLGGSRPDLDSTALDLMEIWPERDFSRGWSSTERPPLSDERFRSASMLSFAPF